MTRLEALAEERAIFLRALAEIDLEIADERRAMHRRGEREPASVIRIVRADECTDAMTVIISLVARTFAVRAADIYGKSRSATVVTARHVAVYVARRSLRMSFPELAKAFQRVDHSSASDAFHEIAKRFETDERLRAAVEAIEAAIPSRLPAPAVGQ